MASNDAENSSWLKVDPTDNKDDEKAAASDAKNNGNSVEQGAAAASDDAPKTKIEPEVENNSWNINNAN